MVNDKLFKNINYPFIIGNAHTELDLGTCHLSKRLDSTENECTISVLLLYVCKYILRLYVIKE